MKSGYRQTDRKSYGIMFKWFFENEQYLRDEKPLEKDLARQMTKELGMPITVSNVKWCKQTTGIQWTIESSSYNPVQNAWNEIKTLKSRLAALESNLVALNAEVKRLRAIEFPNGELTADRPFTL